MITSTNEIAYLVRYSGKARHVQLRISRKGLEVVIPKYLSLLDQDIKALIEKREKWISKHLPRFLHVKPCSLPTTIDLKALNECYQVNYTEHAQPKLVDVCNYQLTVFKPTNAFIQTLILLQGWLKEKAKQCLPQMLFALSEELSLPFTALTIRHVNSRWGSCNTRKRISLATRLLLIPPELCRYVMIHELCHTIEMNHGKRFWTLLERFDPHARLHLRRLRQFEMPAWVFVGRNDKV